MFLSSPLLEPQLYLSCWRHLHFSPPQQEIPPSEASCCPGLLSSPLGSYCGTTWWTVSFRGSSRGSRQDWTFSLHLPSSPEASWRKISPYPACRFECPASYTSGPSDPSQILSCR